MSFFENARHSKFVKYAEKQENSSRFIGYFLDRLSITAEPSPAQCTLSLVARSPASPAARALLAALSDITTLAVSANVMFCQTEPVELMASWLDLAARTTSSGASILIRRAGPPALIDAHEQMVLGTTFSWLGDSMRRDPETRDAFETFECFNSDATRKASRTFDALWPKGEALVASRRLLASPSSELLPAGVLNLTTAAHLGGPSASTRH